MVWFDISFRERCFDSAIEQEVQKGRIEELNWLLTTDMPERARNAIPRILELVCLYKRMDVLLWMQRHGQLDLLDGRAMVVRRTPEIADWVLEHLCNKAIDEAFPRLWHIPPPEVGESELNSQVISKFQFSLSAFQTAHCAQQASKARFHLFIAGNERLNGWRYSQPA